MKITALTENTSARAELGSEHGLSLFIETAETALLFDMGQSDLFARNAEKLHIDLREAEMAVLSHGHYDHGGGLRTFLALNDHAPVYLSRYAFDEAYNAEGKYIGLDPALKNEKRLVFTGEEEALSPSAHLYSCNERERSFPLDSAGLTTLREGRRIPDDFRHEQYLLLEEHGTRVLISGCSHKGIRDLLHWFRPDVLVGGFHLMKTAPGEALEPYAEALGSCGAELFTCHCTGAAQFRYLQERMENLYYLSAGESIVL